MYKLPGSWDDTNVDNLGISFDCGHCGSYVGPSEYYFLKPNPGAFKYHEAHIFICPKCNRPTYLDNTLIQQVPGSLYGNEISYLPGDVENLYEESRNCIKVNAYTSSVLSSRKLLMNIAVSKGAPERKRFQEYVDYLEHNHYIPPGSKDWVDHIRKKGNEATHEIPSIKEDDAKELLGFIEMMLRFTYEFPGKMKKHQPEK